MVAAVLGTDATLLRAHLLDVQGHRGLGVMANLVRRDRNHQEVKDALLAAGCRVYDAARIGGGFPDLLARKPRGPLVMLEVKDGKLPPSARRLNEKEQAFRDLWGDVYHVVLTPEDALKAVGLLPSTTVVE